LLTLGLLAAAGCITAEQQAIPLYDEPTRLGADQVATLGGYVAWVDGRDVSNLGGAFELRPGCHVLTTPTGWGDSTVRSSLKVSTGALTFTIPMVAGRHYLVDNKVWRNGIDARWNVQVDESDASGKVLWSFNRTRSSAEIAACRQQQSAR
jgi:hypothetical protein